MRCAFIEIMATVIDVLWDYSFSRVGGGVVIFRNVAFRPLVTLFTVSCCYSFIATISRDGSVSPLGWAIYERY